MLQSDDVNVAYINFIETFSKLFNLHCPVKKAHAKSIYKKPWITNGLKNACRKKNGLYRSFLRERTHTSEYRYKTYTNLSSYLYTYACTVCMHVRACVRVCVVRVHVYVCTYL